MAAFIVVTVHDSDNEIRDGMTNAVTTVGKTRIRINIDQIISYAPVPARYRGDANTTDSNGNATIHCSGWNKYNHHEYAVYETAEEIDALIHAVGVLANQEYLTVR
jgi:hypothetical protein